MNSITIIILYLSMLISLFELIKLHYSFSKYYFHVWVMITNLMISRIYSIILRFCPFIIMCSPFMISIWFFTFQILIVFLPIQRSFSCLCLLYCCSLITIFEFHTIVSLIGVIQLEPWHILMIRGIINFLHNRRDGVLFIQ